MHLSDDAVARLVAGELADREIEDVDEHLDACEACRALVAAAARSSVLAERSRRGADASTWLASKGTGAEVIAPWLAANPTDPEHDRLRAELRR